MHSFDRETFYAAVRTTLFDGRLTPSQATGIEGLLDEWDATYASHDRRWLAYALATAHHETARRMRPIAEFGAGRGHPYGEPDPATGHRYYGRGFVQLTWAANYKKLGARLGIGDELFEYPDKVLELNIATRIMFVGMIEGLFTDKKLANYFAGAKSDWIGARRIINGTDRASVIAGYGRNYLAAIERASRQRTGLASTRPAKSS